MDTESQQEIGGYFGLSLPDYGNPFPDSFIRFQSARAALRAVLQHCNFQRVMLPAYICDSVVQAVTDAGKTAELYDLDDHLYPKLSLRAIPKDSVLIYVNYFGLCESNISRLLDSFPPGQIIVDNTQALFQLPTDALATIYSPRKFVGVPDGGLLAAPSLKIELPMQEDRGSIARMNHLLMRLAYTGKEGYSSFIEAGASLDNTKPLNMSRLTARILSSIDMTAVKSQRRRNFRHLAAVLDKHNLHNWQLGPDAVPLCYPLVCDRNVESLKEELADRRIYIPTYWRDAQKRIENNGIEHALIHCMLPVPCDQRYSSGQLDMVIHSIISELDRSRIHAWK